MKDRLLGYIVITILIIFLVVPVTYLVWRSVIPGHSAVIEFAPVNSISFLNIQDPVYIRGVEMGQVRKVENFNGKVLASIETTSPLYLSSSYQIAAIPKGIMGDRYLEIDPGDGSQIKVGPADTLKGSFIVGPAEALSLIGTLQAKIHSLTEIAVHFKNGSDESRSFISKFWESVQLIDSIATSIDVFSKALDQQMVSDLDSLVDFLGKASHATSEVSSMVPSQTVKFEHILSEIANLSSKIHSISQHSISITTQFTHPDLLIWSEKLKHLETDLQNIMEVIDILEKEGLKVPVRFRKKR